MRASAELDSQTTTNALKERQSAQPQTTTSGATTGAPPVAATHSLTNTSAKDEGAEVDPISRCSRLDSCLVLQADDVIQ